MVAGTAKQVGLPPAATHPFSLRGPSAGSRLTASAELVPPQTGKVPSVSPEGGMKSPLWGTSSRTGGGVVST